MLKLWYKLKSLFYNFIRDDMPAPFDFCAVCKKMRKNFNHIYKNNHHIGYDKILKEWIIFPTDNFYVKIWIINQDIVCIKLLTEELFNNICNLCRRCLTKYMKSKENESQNY